MVGAVLAMLAALTCVVAGIYIDRKWGTLYFNKVHNTRHIETVTIAGDISAILIAVGAIGFVVGYAGVVFRWVCVCAKFPILPFPLQIILAAL